MKLIKCTELHPLYLGSWCTVQHSHGLCHGLSSCGVGETGKEAFKLWVTEYQVKQTLCVLIKRVLQKERDVIIYRRMVPSDW